MVKKGLLAAGLIVAALAAVPQQASAKTTVNIGIGLGGGGYVCTPYNRWCGGPGPRPYPGRLSCQQGARIVWNHGFNRVMPISCGWKTYIYDGSRGGRHWRVKVNPWNGRMWF